MIVSGIIIIQLAIMLGVLEEIITSLALHALLVIYLLLSNMHSWNNFKYLAYLVNLVNFVKYC